MKNTKGITLIALIVTIIVLIILAGISINLLLGDNGIITNAIRAKKQTDIASLKEETEMELVLINYDSNEQDRELTISEKIDKLKEKGILNDDLTFSSNNKYSVSYTGKIQENLKENVSNVNLVNENQVKEEKVTSKLNDRRQVKVKVIDGSIILDENDSSLFAVKANLAPEGYKFAYFIDDNNQIFYDFNNNQIIENLYTSKDCFFIPVYVKNEIDIPYCDADVNFLGGRALNSDNSGQQLVSLLVTIYYDSNKYCLVELGLLRTYNEELINNLELGNTNVTNNKASDISETSPFTGKQFTYNYTFNIGATSANKSKNIYVRSYGVIKDKNTGEKKIVYSDLSTLYPQN